MHGRRPFYRQIGGTPDDPEAHHGGSGRKYMQQKRVKLRDQFGPSADAAKRGIFAGMTIWVDGYTFPTSDVLRDLIVKNGGTFITTPGSGMSLCVASVLALGKRQRYEALRAKNAGFPVVLPSWIVESDSKGERLPLADFALEGMMDAAQPRADAIFKPRREVAAATAIPIAAAAAAPPQASTFRHDRALRAATEPAAFIANYFNNSRLHFIGSWRSKLRDVLGGAHAQARRAAPRRALRRAATTQRVVVHLDMDCFFASVALIDYPELAQLPVVISHCGDNGSQPSMSEVSCPNYAARAFGVKAGMTYARAKELCGASRLHQLPYPFAAIERVTKRLYSVLVEHCGATALDPADDDGAVGEGGDSAAAAASGGCSGSSGSGGGASGAAPHALHARTDELRRGLRRVRRRS